MTLQSGRYNNAHIILCQFDDLNLAAEFDTGEKVTFTGTVESAKRGKDSMGRARLKGCKDHRRRTEMNPDNGKPRKGII